MYKVRPITLEDISKSRSTQISSVIKTESTDMQLINNDPDVVSEAPYGLDKSDDNPLVESKLYYKSTHVKLSIPIVNIFLAGVQLDVISKILPDKSGVAELAKGTAILKLSKDKDGTHEIIHPNSISNTDVYNRYKHLIGGEAVKYLLNNLDIKDTINKYLISKCNILVSSSIRKNFSDGNVGEIVEGNGDIWIIDNYYLNVCSLDILETIRLGAESVRSSMLAGDNNKGEFMPKLTALLAFRDNPNTFLDMIQDVIPILPYGFRPTIDKSKDPLSILYNRLIQSSNELKNSILTPSCRLDVIRLKYSDVYHKYVSLVYKKSNYDEDKFKPLIDILTGKSGVIRNNVQSSTIDFSGRSVITVDPSMSLDTIGIPEDMALHLCELDSIREFNHYSKNKSSSLEGKYKEAMIKKAKAILQGTYIITGRQPTLYMLGMQAFKVEIVPGYSIVLNPISTPSFNADFDGDQMYVNKPQSKESQEEARKLMANINNVFLPRDGSCHIAPRQEMIYGLYRCYHAKSDEASRTVTYKDNNIFMINVVDDLNMQRVVIDDKCVVGNKSYDTVGYAALKIFLGGERLQNTRLGITPITNDESIVEKCITEDFFKEYFKYVKLNFSTSTFVNLVNRFVRLGFAIANLYAPDVGVLKQIDTFDIKEAFEAKVAYREEYYNLGFDTDESFSLFYSAEYNELEKNILNRVKSSLGDDNGYIQLIESGARGSKSNLLQLFGMKGTILKNQAEAFNAIIKTPLADQLTGLEHFITAYGSRQGVIDKVIGTYAPGYLSRKMTHVTRHLSIVSDDCGTTDGIELTYDFLVDMYGISRLSGRPDADYFMIKEYASKLLETRFIVGGGVSPLTLEESEMVFVSMIAKIEDSKVIDLGGVKLRSPITCKDQCCVRCYGIDLTTNKMVVKGTPIGYLAGPSIGEPVTQLIMKNFQRGGVAGVKNLTSSFDTLSDLLEMYSVSKIKSASEPIIHDYISPVAGMIKTVSRGDGTAKLNIMVDGVNKLKQTVFVYSSVKLKEYVEAGESIQLEQGVLDINEILKLRGTKAAQMFMLFNSYNIFVNEIFVNFKHFEVLINGMTLKLCTKGNEYFKVGNYYSIKEYTNGYNKDCKFIEVVRGLKQIPKIRNDFLTSMFLEDVSRTVKRNIIVSGKDSLQDPFVRISLGLNSGIGTDEPSYIDMRGV